MKFSTRMPSLVPSIFRSLSVSNSDMPFQCLSQEKNKRKKCFSTETLYSKKLFLGSLTRQNNLMEYDCTLNKRESRYWKRLLIHLLELKGIMGIAEGLVATATEQTLLRHSFWKGDKFQLLYLCIT